MSNWDIEKINNSTTSTNADGSKSIWNYQPDQSNVDAEGNFEPDAFDKGFTDYVGSTLKNILPSTVKFGKDIITPILHPIETAKSIGALGQGLLGLVQEGEQPNEDVARAVGEYFSKRYGGMENIAQTFRDDPVGFLSDVSIILTAGTSLAVKSPALAGQVTTNIQNIAKAIDPVRQGANLVKNTAPVINNAPSILSGGKLDKTITQYTGKGIANVQGALTGVGSKNFTIAYLTGSNRFTPDGAKNQKNWTEAINNKGGTADKIVSETNRLIKELNTNNSKNYVDGKTGLKLNEINVPVSVIENLANDLRISFNAKDGSGLSSLSKVGQANLKQIEKIIKDVIKNSKTVDGVKVISLESLDILKKRIQAEYPTGFNIGDTGIPSTDIANKVKDIIIQQSPEYAKVMENFELAKSLQKDLMQQLSIKRNVADHVTLTRLNQALSDGLPNISGKKYDALNRLDDGTLAPLVSGSSLSNWTPTNQFRGAILPSAMTYGLMSGGADGMGIVTALPYIVASGTVSSPKIQGLLSNVAGQGSGLLSQNINLASPFVNSSSKALNMAGRINEEINNPDNYMDLDDYLKNNKNGKFEKGINNGGDGGLDEGIPVIEIRPSKDDNAGKWNLVE